MTSPIEFTIEYEVIQRNLLFLLEKFLHDIVQILACKNIVLSFHMCSCSLLVRDCIINTSNVGLIQIVDFVHLDVSLFKQSLKQALIIRDGSWLCH